MPKKTHPNQTSLFDYEIQRQPSKVIDDANLNTDAELRRFLNIAIKKSPRSRIEIAGEMTRLIYGEYGDKEITKTQLDTWTGASRQDHRFPLTHFFAFCQATNTGTEGVMWVAKNMLVEVQLGEDALMADLGRAVTKIKEAEAAKEKLEAAILEGKSKTRARA